MKKSLLSLILAAAMVVTMFTGVAFAAGSLGSGVIAEVERDTVLILDNSVSMEGEPLVALKKAAVNFCDSVLAAEGNNRVALVVYDTDVASYTDFTSSANTLSEAINDMDGEGNWTNITAGVVKADELLSQSDANIKNIVIMTDGVPTRGKYASIGRYSYQDYAYTHNASQYVYEYANVLYTTATALHSEYNVYTLGFFHNSSTSAKNFGARILRDIQNKGYYEVTNPDELEFAFGDIADDIEKPSGNEPIIIIPGIMGSRLFKNSTDFSDQNKVWDPNISFGGITSLDEQLAVSNTLYVRPPQDQQLLTVDQREYGAQNTYKKLVDGLCAAFPDREVYVFSYDWRFSNAASASSLKSFIDGLGVDRVDLVCHSMGGLVASRYFKDTNGEKIDQIITCGTPYEGAPKLLNAVQNWDVLGGPDDGTTWNDTKDTVLGLFGGMTKNLKASFMGVAELTPTQNYVGKIPMQRDSWVPASFFDYELTFEQYQGVCRKVFSADYNAAYNFQTSLQNKAGVNKGYNVLLDYENAYFMVGINHKTITSIKFQFSNVDIDDQLYESDVDYDTKGDGTVPYLSASIMEQIEKLDSSRVKKVDANHSEVVQIDKCLTWIKDILKKSTSSVADDELSNKPYTVVRIACPVDVTVGSGADILSSDPDTISVSSSFGRLDILGTNDEIKMLCLDADQVRTLNLNGSGNGTMDFTIRFFNGDGEMQEERAAENVPITDTTKITTDTDSSNRTVLSIDLDGDGSVDETVTLQTVAKVQVQEQKPEMKNFSVTATASEGGSITPAGETIVAEGGNIDYSVTADRYYRIHDVRIDGVSHGILDSFTLNNITADHTIEVIFVKAKSFIDAAEGTIPAEPDMPADIGSTSRFYDVLPYGSASKAINFVVDRGIMNGTGAGKFSPDAALTRAMMATILWRMEGEPTVWYNGQFSDVIAGQWYSTPIAWANQAGIVEGYGNGVFGTNDSLTHGQLCAMLYRWNAKTYGDIATAWNWAQANGLYADLAGVSADQAATRAEIAQVLMAFVTRVW